MKIPSLPLIRRWDAAESFVSIVDKPADFDTEKHQSSFAANETVFVGKDDCCSIVVDSYSKGCRSFAAVANSPGCTHYIVDEHHFQIADVVGYIHSTAAAAAVAIRTAAVVPG